MTFHRQERKLVKLVISNMIINDHLDISYIELVTQQFKEKLRRQCREYIEKMKFIGK